MTETPNAATDRTYSGDVTLSGGESTPVDLRGAEDVYVASDGVEDDCRVRDCEYVFTGTPVAGEAAVPDPATRVAGDLDDGYVSTDGVDGNLLVSDGEDVFVEAGAVEGELQAVGAENVFDGGAAPADELSLAPDAFDCSFTGWRRSADGRTVDHGVRLLGARHDVQVEATGDSLVVWVTGWDNDVRVDGGRLDLTVRFVGRDNTVSVGPYANVDVVESGFENTVDKDPVPSTALVQTSKSDAYSNAGFGRSKITYQVPAEAVETCPNPSCKRSADAVVERKTKDAFFLFGVPLYTYEEGGDTYECEHCTTDLLPDIGLSERERREVFGR